jgi:hypothetical protein
MQRRAECVATCGKTSNDQIGISCPFPRNGRRDGLTNARCESFSRLVNFINLVTDSVDHSMRKCSGFQDWHLSRKRAMVALLETSSGRHIPQLSSIVTIVDACLIGIGNGGIEK